ncbi:DUF2250 domain-containing protein [Thermoproteus tenax]|uniref:DUF2250 domain-containing protein n=1 Tax=Thermoproteus tenax (strain ATCC 35583 / DSM 2078 / JCM 9277 / NBRC 100435 / Kra 1) TaxID=768679 RepID=G4RM81_THETK|nr:DUF2250 domain-containing protein [Thermoproteus tenax]CCC82676.1 conserved hypothetical protein [Thermoproteus tenax Kra 1]
MKDVLRKKLYIDILFHLKRAYIDYGKSIAKNLRVDLSEVIDALERLEELGLIERVGGHTLKRSKARFKLSNEVRKHHIYYKLSRAGELLLREVAREGPRAYLDVLSEEEKRALVDICRGHRVQHRAFIEMGLTDRNGGLTELGAKVASLLCPTCKLKLDTR